MNKILTTFLLLILSSVFTASGFAQHSVARMWNEVLLESIRNDFARPTIHARNLFHSSVALYDAWAAFEDEAQPFFLGKEFGGFELPFDGMPLPEDKQAAQEEAMSYAVYRLLKHRFRLSPGGFETEIRLRELMEDLGYDINFTGEAYGQGSAAALGNYLGNALIAFGLAEYCNETNDYKNLYYEVSNPPLAPILPGNPNMVDPNRWQPLSLNIYIDQAGNIVPINTPEFLSPEWGLVTPFALKPEDLSIYERDGHEYWVYHDPGVPPQIDTTSANGWAGLYEWNFALVSIWSSHLDPGDTTMWDISPRSIGNIQSYPTTEEEYRAFYNLLEGGDPGTGYELNPHTGLPYESQFVRRSDYARVLAEYWADGPDSETPPGHWFTILNYVSDHPLFEKHFQGTGAILDDLEWDVKAYFVLAGAVHDAAVASWGIKGWYDYPRPISAIRYMAEQGQSSDPNLPNYNAAGIPLQEGFIELVQFGDPLAGSQNQHVGKIKLLAWRGPDYIDNPTVDAAGVGWILAEEWWPYQRPTFVSPPFGGYLSGHSTFSRAAAEVMTLLTGDPFFPGGKSEFLAPKNEFLVFEEGPTVDIILQWATYRDAADQTSLSRIWGGIHPPADDIPGRFIGEVIGIEAFNYAIPYFTGMPNAAEEESLERELPIVDIFPNPIRTGQPLAVQLRNTSGGSLSLYDQLGQAIKNYDIGEGQEVTVPILTRNLSPGVYLVSVDVPGRPSIRKKIVVY
jgi:hypothetical protein